MNGNYIAASALALIALSKRQGSMGRRGRKRREWTEEQIGLLGTATDAEVATALGVSLSSVSVKRRELGIEPYGWKTKSSSDLGNNFGSEEPTTERRGYGQLLHREWVEDQIDLLGNFPDWEIARLLDTHEYYVADKRRELGIDPFPIEEWNANREKYDWTPEKIALLGTMTDRDLSALWGDIHYSTIARKRMVLGIPSFGGTQRNYEDFDFSIIPISAFHHSPDSAISRDYGVDNSSWVKRYREENNIMGYQEYFDTAYNLCKILPYRFVAKVMGYDDISSFKNRLRSRLQKDIGSRFGKFHDHIVEDFPVNMSPPDANSFTPDLLFNIGTATSFMLAYWYPASFADIEKVKQYLNIEPYTRTITDPLTDLSPDEIALFFTKSDEWNSEAFGIPLRTIKGMRLYYMEHFGLYPPGVTEDQKSRLVERIAQQMRKASSEIYQTRHLSTFRRRR